MKRIWMALALTAVLATSALNAFSQDSVGSVAAADTSLTVGSVEDLVGDEDMAGLQEMAQSMNFHQQLKTKFVEGSAGFMSLVALALVLGLAVCIERIIYLTLSEVNAKRLLADIEKHVEADDVEGAKTLCRETRGPVASICYQGLMHCDEPMDAVERSVVSYGTVQTGNLERGCSWIKLFIAIAPSLGFLGTVIGMVMAFDQIQEAGDIGPAIVAEGMKVALITTIFGIIVALILQVFYNFILSKIEHLTSQMEESAVTLLDILTKRQMRTQR
ncbi:MAG: MotA/TolQ/ExbB proton channel family protein [Prevotella sp.]|nr:MotA/TolQ/ExbB proton channel family protein [Prevotella sp.]